MSKNAEKYRKYYKAGWYNKAMLANLVAKGALTEAEYEEITGDQYEE